MANCIVKTIQLHTIDYLHTEHPAWGTRRITATLVAKGYPIGVIKICIWHCFKDIFQIFILT
ncbi:MAG: hypothetical protein K0Q87_2464 [Neobacillus sp.]|nr:hypothetical protein [Neobacillus sp.]